MKFLCDQCKAKYQIADEKVQGKTLRMKCRKCGHVIEIRATTEAAQTGETMQVASLSDDAAQAALRPSIPAPAPAAPRPAVAAPRPAAGGAPRPAAGGAPRPGTTSAGAKPGVPKPEPKAPAGGALASAFNKQVSGHAIADAPVSTTPTGPEVPAEEWYVAIDDVPVGPIRLTELRAKYAQGAVNDDSLVWREGYEEWRPLRTLHELHTVVREEVSGAQLPPRGSSLLPNGSSAARNAPRTSAPTSGGARPSTRPAAPVAAPRAGGAGNVIPFVQARGAVAARKLDEEQMDDEATQMFAAPMVPPPKPAEPAPISGSLAKNKDDPFGFGVLPEAPAAAAAAPTPAPAPVVAAPVAEEPAQRKGGLASGTVALIAAACILLGVVVAVFAVKPKVVERVVEKQVNVPVSVYVPVASDSTPAPTVAAAAPEPSTTTAGAKVAAKSPGAAAATTAAPTTTVTNKKLGSLDGPEGPAVGGTGGGGGGGGGALEGKAVEGVIATKRVGVRKVCFEPWADKGGASVKITLKIGPDGRVQSSDIANTSGEPAIGQCVQRLSKGWTFPASESGGTFNVPFLFGS